MSETFISKQGSCWLLVLQASSKKNTGFFIFKLFQYSSLALVILILLHQDLSYYWIYVASYIDHHEMVDGVNFRKSIFIFLSNTGG